MNQESTGFLLIDKPTTWTSHDVVGYLRGVTKIKKIGHAGTLDPFATGLLIVGVGRAATKRLDDFKGMKKEYIATIHLGATSTTYDPEGEILKTQEHENIQTISREKIIHTLKTFEGKQTQLPPMYSAKKIDGQKLYDLARQGIEIERKTHDIEIYNIDLLEVDGFTRPGRHRPQGRSGRGLNDAKEDIPNNTNNVHPQTIQINVSCSTGTYIRTLAHDIGQKLGVGAYCEELRRTKIGDYSVEDAIGPKELSRETWQERLIDA